jgi:osmotically inducible protein OsmC
MWTGEPPRGKMVVSTDSRVLSRVLYGWSERAKAGITNPAELIAAAHAGSYSNTLAQELQAVGLIAHQIHTTATATMERIGTHWAMTRVHLDVVAAVPQAEQVEFVDAALRAKANCPVSRLLIANISMQAKLTPGPLPNKSKRSRPQPA